MVAFAGQREANKKPDREHQADRYGAAARRAGGSSGRIHAMNLPEQVLRTEAAEQLMETLSRRHGPLMFHQSGGCCDGSSPMCYPLGEFLVGDSDILVAMLGETPFYMSRSQFEYWKHTQLILDVVPGRGGMFSLEGSEGVRFLIRSRVFTDAEIGALRAASKI